MDRNIIVHSGDRSALSIETSSRGGDGAGGGFFAERTSATINNTNNPGLRLTPARSKWIRALYREFGSI